MKFLSLSFIMTLSLMVIGCSGGNQKQEGSSSGQSLADKAKKDKEERDKGGSRSMGEKIYLQNCGTCHQSNGSGVPNMYPPLQETKWVNGEKERLIKVLLEGLTGEITVKGKTYNQQMPANNNLSDEQIAAVLTYIRQNFGNDASEIKPDEVAEVRKSLEK